MISYPWLEEVAQKLDQLLSSKVLTLEGPKGLGKKEIAHEIAKHKLCSSNNACGDCNACKTFVAGTHPDFFILNNPDSESIKVDQVRELIEFMNLSATSQHKVAIIETCNLMTIQAQNALLKIAEDLNEKSSLILVSDQVRSLLPTIYSRSHRLLIKEPSRIDIDSWIKSLGYHDETVFNFPSYFSPLDILEAIKSGETAMYREIYSGFQNLLLKGSGYEKFIKHFKDLSFTFNEKLVFLNDCLKIQLGKNLNFYPRTENTKELSQEEIFNLSNLIDELTQQIFDLSKVKGLNEQVGMNYFLSKVHSIYN